jgi:hypothetical protein
LTFIKRPRHYTFCMVFQLNTHIPAASDGAGYALII